MDGNNFDNTFYMNGEDIMKKDTPAENFAGNQSDSLAGNNSSQYSTGASQYSAGASQSTYGGASQYSTGTSQSTYGGASQYSTGTSQSTYGGASQSSAGTSQSTYGGASQYSASASQYSAGTSQSTYGGASQYSAGTSQSTYGGASQSTYGDNQNKYASDDKYASNNNKYGRDFDNYSSSSYNYSSYTDTTKESKDKKPFLPKILCALAIGLVFGIAAGAGLYAVTRITGLPLIQSAAPATTDNAEIDKLKEELSKLEQSIIAAEEGNEPIDLSNLMLNAGNADVVSVVDKVMPSMVSVTNMYEEEYTFWGHRYSEEMEASGSGIIIGENDKEYLLVTNNHVIEDYVKLTLQFVDGTTADAYEKGHDAAMDIAVIAVNKSDLSDSTKQAIKVAQMGDSESLKIGEPAIAIGNALGYGQSVTTGVISALNRDIDMENTSHSLIQTNAAINPGNSGGALLNTAGEVVGINSNKIGGSAVEGMGYAIPISDVKEIIENFMNRTTSMKYNDEKRGYIGIQGTSVDAATSENYGIPQGIYVTKVYQGGAAENAGIIKGDVITKVDGVSVGSLTDLQELLAYYEGGQQVEVTIQHAGVSGYTEQVVMVTLTGRTTIESGQE